MRFRLLVMVLGCALSMVSGCSFEMEGGEPECGDDLINTSIEECDYFDLGGMTCADLFSGFVGTLRCDGDCRFDASECLPDGCECGDGALCEGYEDCDGVALGGAACETMGFQSGDLSCSTTCTYNTSACVPHCVCGDGLLCPELEECDLFDLGGATCADFGYDVGQLACTYACLLDTTECTIATCGNGVIDGSESCDGSNLSSQDCTDWGYPGGTLACLPDCSAFDLSGCQG